MVIERQVQPARCVRTRSNARNTATSSNGTDMKVVINSLETEQSVTIKQSVAKTYNIHPENMHIHANVDRMAVVKSMLH